MSKRNLSVLLVAVLIFVLAQASLTSAQDDTTIPPADLSNPAAPFIFSYEYAVQQGATAEWRKLEGVAANNTTNELYYAVTAVAKGMADTEGDIQLPENKCGAIFAGSLDADLNVAALNIVLAGGPYDESNPDYPCNPDAISNPDNIFVDPSGNLWIGEDTDYHLNQMLWMWDGTELKRFATMPSGAEVTGLRVEPDGTIFLNIQHPYATNTYPFNRATVGVITGYQAGQDFEPVPVPTGDATKTLTLAAGEYQVLGRTGEAFPSDVTDANAFFGQITNADGTTQSVCNNPDGNMFLPVDSTGNQGYLYTNWECSPGALSKLFISRDADGNWTSVEGGPVDVDSINGISNPCNASVTPWNTGLTSQEYPADVQGEWEEGWLPTVDAWNSHLGRAASPLDYGYSVELVPAGGESDGIGTIVTEHYVMGRFSHEMGLVLSDNRTVYFGDDGTDRVLFKFVADTAGDLSAGTLYAAQITQDGETLNLNWLPLGTSNDADVAAQLQVLNASYAAGS